MSSSTPNLHKVLKSRPSPHDGKMSNRRSISTSEKCNVTVV